MWMLRGLRNNYILLAGKLIFFVLSFCFLIKFTMNFLQEIEELKELKIEVFLASVLSTLIFYIFIADLNSLYEKIQGFFLKSPFLLLLIPVSLIILGIGYFIIPKVLNISFNKDIFLFVGGVFLMMHLIFIAHRTRGSTFVDFINYLFTFTLLCIISLFLLGFYLRVGSRIQIEKIIWSSAQESFSLMKDVFTQIFAGKSE